MYSFIAWQQRQARQVVGVHRYKNNTKRYRTIHNNINLEVYVVSRSS